MKRRRRGTTSHLQRDAFDIPNDLYRPVPDPVPRSLLSDLSPRRRYLTGILPDRRRFTFAHRVDERRGRSLSGGVASVSVRPRKASRRSVLARDAASSINFREAKKYDNPKHVDICVKRHQRREVLFALLRTGRGSKKKERRRNEESDVHCK